MFPRRFLSSKNQSIEYVIILRDSAIAKNEDKLISQIPRNTIDKVNKGILLKRICEYFI